LVLIWSLMGEPGAPGFCHGWSESNTRTVGVVAKRSMALAAWRGGDRRAVALHSIRYHADQQHALGNRARRCRAAKPGFDRDMGPIARRTHRIRHERDIALFVGVIELMLRRRESRG